MTFVTTGFEGSTCQYKDNAYVGEKEGWTLSDFSLIVSLIALPNKGAVAVHFGGSLVLEEEPGPSPLHFP